MPRAQHTRGVRYPLSRGALGESSALQSVIATLLQAQSDATAGRTKKVQLALQQSIEVLGDLEHQARRGVHKNPPLMIFSNPPRSSVISEDVQAVVYRHKTDGEYYCHAFGTEDFSLTSRRGALTITGLVSRTGCQAIELEDGSAWLRRRDGKPIVEDR